MPKVSRHAQAGGNSRLKGRVNDEKSSEIASAVETVYLYAINARVHFDLNAAN